MLVFPVVLVRFYTFVGLVFMLMGENFRFLQYPNLTRRQAVPIGDVRSSPCLTERKTVEIGKRSPFLLLENKILHSRSKDPRLCHEWQFFNFQHYSQIMETKSQLVFIEITIYRSARHCVFHAYYQSHFCSFRNVDVKSFDIISLIHQVPLELSASAHLFLLLFVLMSLVAGTIYINLCLWGQKIIFAELLISFKG